MSAGSTDFEKMGALYLGRVRDTETDRTTDEIVLLDSKDLTTHGVCVGMTGSGKTGLCVDLLEEAAIDGIPSIVIDPKGDLGNLLLTFPALSPDDFRPWIDEAEAAREGRTVDEQASAVATRWREGLAAWGQDGSRIERLRAAADFVIWTPGSSAGAPISILRSFAAPPAEIVQDADALRERILGTVSSLLALAGITADPLRSREHVLLSNLLDSAWREGRNLDIAGLIAEIQKPPFTRVGVVDLESFYPSKDRFELAMALNNLIASPAFAAWMEGEPLDAARLLVAPDGRPRVSVVSIAHLSEPERMFFVTLLLQEVIGWMRRQPGTGSLRAILFMDEVFGFLPPTANPPSKTPMLTLLKQARAYGVGVVLATQNPVDLDYKALSNAGTWMLGRLQTERDKLRLLDGLEGASSSKAFDRSRAEAVLSGLGKRQFMLVSAHEDDPIVFETRWAMSYLRGPLTRPQIQSLMEGRKEAMSAARVAAAPAAASAAVTSSPGSASKPVLPPDVPETFLAPAAGSVARDTITYRPMLLVRARLHHVATKEGVDAWRDLALLAPLPEDGAPALDDAEPVGDAAVGSSPVGGARFEAPPAITSKELAAWSKEAARHAHAERPLELYRCAAVDAVSNPGESEAEFRARLAHAARERRDVEIEKLRAKHAPKVERLRERLRKAEQRVEVQKGQAAQQRTSAMLTVGSAVLGALFGRRGTSVTRATSAARGFGRAAQEKQDVERAREDVATVQADIARLEADLATDVATIEDRLDPAALEIETLAVPPRKGDISVTLAACWTPWIVDAGGLARRAW